MTDYVAVFLNPTAALQVIINRKNVGVESVRRWHLRMQVNFRQRCATTSAEMAGIGSVKAKARRLEKSIDNVCQAPIFFEGELDPRDQLSSHLLTSAARTVMRPSRSDDG